ncbi:hypothetical protein BC828DRAFT_254324 [Blastocladiella britannica]|nr:hypothetical protein BC828DRAFT_254324 [Blastocladiella britannica]
MAPSLSSGSPAVAADGSADQDDFRRPRRAGHKKPNADTRNTRQAPARDAAATERGSARRRGGGNGGSRGRASPPASASASPVKAHAPQTAAARSSSPAAPAHRPASPARQAPPSPPSKESAAVHASREPAPAKKSAPAGFSWADAVKAPLAAAGVEPVHASTEEPAPVARSTPDRGRSAATPNTAPKPAPKPAATTPSPAPVTRAASPAKSSSPSASPVRSVAAASPAPIAAAANTAPEVVEDDAPAAEPAAAAQTKRKPRKKAAKAPPKPAAEDPDYIAMAEAKALAQFDKQTIEWAQRAIHAAQRYTNQLDHHGAAVRFTKYACFFLLLVCVVLTECYCRHDNDFYAAFRRRFPKLEVTVVDEEQLTTDMDAWNQLLSEFYTRIPHARASALLRRDARDAYGDTNTIVVLLGHFYAFELARNREGVNLPYITQVQNEEDDE